jgi:hypothetical protein
VSPNKEARREQELPQTNIEELELAVLAKKLEEVRPPAPKPSVEPEKEPVLDRQEVMLKIADLRHQLAESQIRRDELYIQNDAVGYRREVTKMIELLHQIDEIESQL